MDVVATAGHVDHGKSTLVRALTGMEPDRWAEERRRGMTIDLGFAWTTLGTGRTVAFVDVPGHERFMANMLAGAGPAPAVVFVVAADESWSAQSADHLAALHALGVRHGLIAVTKSDRADPAAAGDRARTELASTTLGECPVVNVSAVTGRGLDELRGALDAMLAGVPAPRTNGRVRLWIDRSFSIRGSGTVVTGTLTAGTLRVGDQLVVAATGERAHVRALQSLGAPVDVASAVARVAVNVRGVEPDSLARGQSLLTPDAWLAVTEVDVRLTDIRPRNAAIGAAGDVVERPLPTHLIAHIGSAAVPVRLRPLGARHARLHFEHALPLAVGDRLVLRDPGMRSIVAGAVALDVLVLPLDRRGAAATLGRTLTEGADELDLAAVVSRKGCVRSADLVRAGWAHADGPPPTGVVEVQGWWVSETRWQAWVSSLDAAVAAQARSSPLHPGLPRSAAVAAAALPDERLLDAVVAAADSLVIDAHGVHGAAPSALPAPVASALAAVERQLAVAPFAAPEADDLAALGLDTSALAACVRVGTLIAIAPGVYLLPDAPSRALQLLRAAPQPFSMGDAKAALGATRRVAVPLLELLDRLGSTRRIDDAHRIVVHERQ